MSETVSRTVHGVPPALADVAEAVAGELDLDRLLPLVVASARRVTGARYAALGVLSPDGRQIVRFVHEGMEPADVTAIGAPPQGHGLLGMLINEPRTIISDDIAGHPDSCGFPSGHPAMSTFLGTPVRAGGRVFGNLYLTDAPGGFDDSQARDVEVLAVLAGLAVQAAELASQLRIAAVQDERDRISRDLHDGVIQQLFSTGMALESARGMVGVDPERVEQRLDAAVDSLDATIRDIRNTIFTLRPGTASELGLERGLIELAREYEVNAILRPGVRLLSSLDPHVPEVLVPDVLNIVREAFSNAARHAEAQRVHLQAEVRAGYLHIDVADSGRGFDPSAVVPGDGLGNMAERAALLGARLEVRSTVGEGTIVRLEVPLVAGGLPTVSVEETA